MGKKNSVMIMMATYNGEKYLSEQIESIINQTFTNWKLIIQDDGSSDRTVEIIRSYVNLDSRIRFIVNDSSCHGAYYNFHSMANKCKKMEQYDYYMFCDQDDVWHFDKIAQLVDKISEKADTIPLLCYADMQVIDKAGILQYKSINEELGLSFKNKYSVFFSHNVFGCNAIMNKSLFFCVPQINIKDLRVKELAHDNLYTKFAAVLGEIIYLPEVLMDYRRHGENVTAKQEYGFSIKRIIGRVAKLDNLAKDHALTYRQTLMAIDLLQKTDGFESNFIVDCKKAILSGGFFAMKIVIKYKISWGNNIKSISRCLILISRKYLKYL